MWFRLSVADRESGVETKWNVEGRDEADAIKRAEAKGYLISACEPIAHETTHGGKAPAHPKEPKVGSMVHFILPDGAARRTPASDYHPPLEQGSPHSSGYV